MSIDGRVSQDEAVEEMKDCRSMKHQWCRSTSVALDFQCLWFEVNQHPVADVMPVLLKSGQSASREEAVEEMKDCRSMKQQWCRSTVMPEYGLSIFYDR
ncbi:hypothetical protein F2Q68_00004696 [Brassica cretica]|uniref:Uncharacterized protein n=2 Tax=Brassica cretica TaxID=69181 RepID=A0ABQ7BU52_BRACR|nr:hypothetical protein F2Q68_00004696 [Brassica cretica]KAF3542974.1 hypothetical protein DY000_02006958 [Brassica cretica]